MSYRTILVHVDQSRHAARRIACAVALARRFDAHLVGTAVTGVSRFLLPGSVESGGQFLVEQIALMRTAATQALEKFDAIVAEAALPKWEHRYVNDDLDGGLALQTLYADLLVISQSDRTESQPGDIGGLPEYLLMNSPRPLLLLPNTASFEQVGQQVVVAWDGSMEAAHAVTCALPLLKTAQQVTVLVFNPDNVYSGNGYNAESDFALYLARHGVKVDLRVHAGIDDVGTALLTSASDLNADLLVMGGYGHTRWREMLLGGVTRTVLDKMCLPVLMAH
jgi:nucleotide-binding universal stress UspA family protein